VNFPRVEANISETIEDIQFLSKLQELFNTEAGISDN